MSAARPCPVCRDAPVPPVTLVPCGHRLCGPCTQVMRVRADTRDQARRAGFRCPECRVLAATYVVSVADRAATTVSAADQAQNDAFMQDYLAGAPTAAPATDQEMQAIYGDEDSDSDSDSDSDDGIALGLAMGPWTLVPFDMLPLNAFPTSQPVLRRSQRRPVGQQVDTLEARVSPDLRIWTPTHNWGAEDIIPLRLTLYMEARPSRVVFRAFSERMRRRGVTVRNVAYGLELWLPAERRAQFLAG